MGGSYIAQKTWVSGYVRVSQKALVEYSKDSRKDNENSWSRAKEDNSNFISVSAYSKYSLYCLETSRQDKTKTWTKILVLGGKAEETRSKCL